MSGAVMNVREEIRSFHERRPTLAMRNAVAQIARRRWPTNGIKQAMGCWRALTEGEARNLYYGNCSANAYDKILHDNKNGGWPLYLEIGAVMFGLAVDQFASTEIERLNDEHARGVASNRRLLQVVGGSSPPDPVGPDRPAGLGG